MSEEIRRPSDTFRMSRADIEEALAAQHRDTLPLPVQEAIASAQGVSAEVCPLCHQGLVSPDVAAKARGLIDTEEQAQVTTQPVKR